ncbi:hypothetical protein FO519_008619, partial [Halicephalobus sp. NKZ332]
DFDDQVKFIYLIGALKGAAARTVEGLAVTSECYGIAKRMLEERYGNPKRIKSILECDLNKLPKCSENASTKQIRGLMYRMVGILRQLETMGEDINTIHTEGMVRRLFPKWIIMQITPQLDENQPWSMEETRKAIDKVIQLEEYATLLRGPLERITLAATTTSPEKSTSRSKNKSAKKH